MYAVILHECLKLKSVSDLQDQFDSGISKVAEWFKANKLTVKVDKTKVMIFGTNRMLQKFHNVQLIYNDYQIERVDEVKNLGVKD